MEVLLAHELPARVSSRLANFIAVFELLSGFRGFGISGFVEIKNALQWVFFLMLALDPKKCSRYYVLHIQEHNLVACILYTKLSVEQTMLLARAEIQ
jgi:hypothetical protein